MNPLVSIIIPCYNAEDFILQALNSIKNQSYKTVEVFIIDDGSSDSSVSICEKFAEADSRFSLLKNKTNQGVATSLNRGIELAKGKYIARMDADDISHPERIKTQTDYLERNSDISLVGVNAYLLNEKNEKESNRNPIYLQSNTLSYSTYFNQPFFGGCIFGKSKVFKQIKFKKGYTSEDYEFALNAVSSGFKLANISTALYGYRKNLESISNTNHSGQIDSHNRSSLHYLRLLHQKKLDKTIVEIANHRPSVPINYRQYLSAIKLFHLTGKILKLQETKEVLHYRQRQKIDISIQAMKKAKTKTDKLLIILKLSFVSINKTGLRYISSKLLY